MARLLVGQQSADRRAREADQGHVAVVEVNQRPVELVGQAGTPGTRAACVRGPEHDVVGEKLRAALEQVRLRQIVKRLVA
jgi:hypothetical protein